MSETLKNIRGKFLLSYNDTEVIRELYKGFNIIEVSRQNGINHTVTSKDSEYKELLIKNY